METHKNFDIVEFVFIGGISLFVFFLYTTMKINSTSLKNSRPFNEWVGKTVLLDKETFLFKENPITIFNRKHPYALINEAYPHWNYLNEKADQNELERIASFPLETQLIPEKTMQYTNSVSGSSMPVIFGSISDGIKDYKISYQWGVRVKLNSILN